MKGLKGQALVSALFAAVTRGMGFVLRLWMSSLLGAQVMGMAEMAGGVQQLLCTPLIGGLPLALSRLTAMEAESEKGCAFYVARRMALRRGTAMAVLCVAGAPFFARALGDMRLTLVLMCFAPALPVISVCCALDVLSITMPVFCLVAKLTVMLWLHPMPLCRKEQRCVVAWYMKENKLMECCLCTRNF